MPSTTTSTVPLPSSTTLSTPSLPPATTKALITHLTTTPTLTDLASTLRDSLARNGWTDRVRHLALELLRSGQCSTYPELVEEVLRRAGEIKREGGNKGVLNGEGGKGEVGQRAWDDVRVPRQSVVDGVEFLKGRLREAVEVVDGEGGEEGESE